MPNENVPESASLSGELGVHMGGSSLEAEDTIEPAHDVRRTRKRIAVCLLACAILGAVSVAVLTGRDDVIARHEALVDGQRVRCTVLRREEGHYVYLKQVVGWLQHGWSSVVLLPFTAAPEHVRIDFDADSLEFVVSMDRWKYRFSGRR